MDTLDLWGPQLKIIYGPGNALVKIYLDGRRIGLIQDFKFRCDANSHFPEIEIVFPDLFQAERAGYASVLLPDLKEWMSLLKEIPTIKVTLQPL